MHRALPSHQLAPNKREGGSEGGKEGGRERERGRGERERKRERIKRKGGREREVQHGGGTCRVRQYCSPTVHWIPADPAIHLAPVCGGGRGADPTASAGGRGLPGQEGHLLALGPRSPLWPGKPLSPGGPWGWDREVRRAKCEAGHT